MPCKTIAGTTVVVDEFKSHRDTEGAMFFLTHFHSDHYGGVLARHTVHCTRLTGQLLRTRCRCNVVPLQLDTPVRLTPRLAVVLVDANHCPGSCMFLFHDTEAGDRTLFTGDFRYDALRPVCARWPRQLRGVGECFVDTTYLAARGGFPTQDEAVRAAVDAVRRHYVPGQTKLICQTYAVGKERVFVELARQLGVRFYPGSAARGATLRVLYGADFARYFCAEDTQGGVLDALFGEWRLRRLADGYAGRYKVVIGVYATGWGGQFSVREGAFRGGRLVTVTTPYSEHCSRDELLAFCDAIGARQYRSIVRSSDTAALARLVRPAAAKPRGPLDAFLRRKKEGDAPPAPPDDVVIDID